MSRRLGRSFEDRAFTDASAQNCARPPRVSGSRNALR